MISSTFIILFAIFFAVSCYAIIKRDTLCGFLYIFLFIYTIFAQIGYVYFPELSELIKAYFGPELFYSFSAFVALSFISFFSLYWLFYKSPVRRPFYRVVSSMPRLEPMFYALVLFHITYMLLYLISNYHVINYANAGDESFVESLGTPFFIFGIGFKHSVFIILMLYFLLRVKSEEAQKVNVLVIVTLLLSELILFSFTAFRLGNRTDILALTLGFLFVEIELMRHDKIKYATIATMVLVLIAVIVYLIVIEGMRGQEFGDEHALVEIIIYKDYYAPAHILLAAMGLNYVNPWEVFISNIANSLVLLKHPYLQETVTELFNPGVTTRSASYAFYIFSEGYIALGKYGFLYNGFIVFLGISLWKILSSSTNKYYNFYLLSLMATQTANIVRGQSSYFVKDIYVIFIPAMFMFFLATGLVPIFKRRKNYDYA